MAHPNARNCAISGCGKAGDYRAPKPSRDSFIKDDASWLWLCLEHVREYNANWNYYKDMTEEEVTQHWRNDLSWERPSWPLGKWKSGQFYQNPHAHVKDPFGFFNANEHIYQKKHDASPAVSYTEEEKQAILFFDLHDSLSKDSLQVIYRELVKKYHPDLNPGCKKSADMIKRINLNYGILKKLLCDSSGTNE